MYEKNNIPQGWTIAKLGDICFTTSGGTPSRKVSNYYGGNIPWVKSGELDKGLILDTEEKITEEAIKNSSAKVFPKGTLLIALYGATVGKLAFLGIEATTNQAVCGIYKSEAIESKLLYYFLQLEKSNLVGQSIGGAQPNISQGIIKDLNIPLAPLPEQHRILAKLEQLLTDLDKGIEYLETSKQQLKVYRQAVLKWAFEGKLTNEKNIRWGVLKEVIEGVEYGSAAKSKKQGKVPVLRMGNIQNGKFEWDDLVYTDNKEEIEKYLLKKDDVLFNRTNSPEWVGKTAIYKGEQPAIFAGYLIRINRKENALDPNYLNYFLNSQIAKNHGNKVKSFGVNQSNINGTKLKQYLFPICSLDSQKAIVKEIESRLSVCDKIEETLESTLQQAEALRLSIIKIAFEGKLVPQYPSDEPAEKLLERIRAEKGNGKSEKKEKAKTSKKKKVLVNG